MTFLFPLENYDIKMSSFLLCDSFDDTTRLGESFSERDRGGTNGKGSPKLKYGGKNTT